MLKRSRLSKRLEERSRRSFFLTSIIIFGILYLLYQFGIPLLGSVGVFISKSSNEPLNSQKEILVPPILELSDYATKSAQIQIKGNATENVTVQLFINDDLVDKIKSKKDGSFEFENITLEKGENSIKTKAVSIDNTESDFSKPISILLINEPPTLSIDSPGENQTFSKEENSINVSGKTDPGVRITVNGFWAITNDTGNYMYQLQLREGENIIKVVGTDEAGNTKEMERKVTYSP